MPCSTHSFSQVFAFIMKTNMPLQFENEWNCMLYFFMTAHYLEMVLSFRIFQLPAKTTFLSSYFFPSSMPITCMADYDNRPVYMHCTGGPTAETRGILNLSIQYWTSRGWAFVDVNYGGSTGTLLFFPSFGFFFVGQIVLSLAVQLILTIE